MKQHSVPQEIMSVEFNLFGAMTIRQFGYVAGAGGLGYFMYLIMPGVLRWPSAGACVIFGLALAFIPINDRPLDQYVTNFLVSLRNPTRRVWRKTPQPPAFLVETAEEIKKKSAKGEPVVIEKKHLKGAGVFSGERKTVETDEETEIEKEIDHLIGSVTPVEAETADFPREQKIEQVSESTEGLAEKVESKTIESDVPSQMESIVEQKESFLPGKSLTMIPNLINGIVLDYSGKPVVNAVVMVKDSTRKPVQAVKVNSRGEFLPKTPLSDGEYTVSVQAPEVRFDPKSLRMDGNVIPLVKFIANKSL